MASSTWGCSSPLPGGTLVRRRGPGAMARAPAHHARAERAARHGREAAGAAARRVPPAGHRHAARQLRVRPVVAAAEGARPGHGRGPARDCAPPASNLMDARVAARGAGDAVRGGAAEDASRTQPSSPENARELQQAHVTVVARLPLFRMRTGELAKSRPGRDARQRPRRWTRSPRCWSTAASAIAARVGQVRGRLGLRITEAVATPLPARPERDREGRAM